MNVTIDTTKETSEAIEKLAQFFEFKAALNEHLAAGVPAEYEAGLQDTAEKHRATAAALRREISQRETQRLDRLARLRIMSKWNRTAANHGVLAR